MMASMGNESSAIDVAIVGGGAAGLAAAIFCARLAPGRSVVVLDGAAKLGAKILISGGGRCNVTNRVVTPGDFCGGNTNVIKQILAAFPAERAAAFFNELGVELYEEEGNGKLFPTTDKARTVLDALLREAARLSVRILTKHRVAGVRRESETFCIDAGDTQLIARNVVLATGGKSFPKTGSDGLGYELAKSLGHSLVPTTPSLAPLILDGDFHAPLSGIAHDVELIVQAAGGKPDCAFGALLWTHFGVSGPVALDVSRHWHRARLEGRDVAVFVNFVPGENAAGVEEQLLAITSSQPRVQLRTALSRILPARVADAMLSAMKVPASTPMAHLPKDVRRKVANALVRWPLAVRDSRGYAYAEVTAGGIPFSEVVTRTLGSRKCPGLYFVGEILDVDGRIGGFNFQWAWSSAWVVANALAREYATGSPSAPQ